MARSDAERWDARYADLHDDIKPRWPDALDGLELDTVVPSIGRALDVACGRGAQTVWMAQRGLTVIALDTSATAIDYLRSRSRDIDHKLSAHLHDHVPFAHRIDARVHDLDDGLPDDASDFDLIVCQRFRAPHLYEPLLEALRPGGWLVMTVLSETGAVDPGEFHAPPGELTLFFDRPGCSLVAHAEADGQESIVIRSNA